MKQFSLFGDDNFEEAPKKNKKVAAPKPTPSIEKDTERVVESDLELNIVPVENTELEIENEPAIKEKEPPELQPLARPIPLGDIEADFEIDEKSLEENYVREVFIFEEPSQEFAKEESLQEEKTEEKKGISKVESAVKSKTTRGRLKLSHTHLAASSIEVPEDEILFSKKYYSIGVVAKMFDVNISLLRYWENEFTILKPRKNGKGDRHFRPEDIKNLQLIHHLLREKKYTLEGAKDFLKKTKNIDAPLAIIENLKDLKSFLLEIKTNL